MAKIEELKKLTPHQRTECLERLFQKNKKFFSDNFPSVAHAIRSGGAAPFHIDVTEDFLTIKNIDTQEFFPADVSLDAFAKALGDWTNNVWIDLINSNIYVHKDFGKYSQFPRRFYTKMFRGFPNLVVRMKNGTINLPTLANSKRFSNSVVFVGIFHGLHIDHFLSRTQLNHAIFIEPDVSRFVLSCYFLDYQALHHRFGGLVLQVGKDLPQKIIDSFLTKSPHTAPVWIRVLPGYATDKVEPLLRQIRLQVRNFHDSWLPADVLIGGIKRTQQNIDCGQRIFSESVQLSSKSRIAVIGNGPSLSDSLDWLQKNQSDIIIFAAHSAVSALQSVGVNPDFQFSLEMRDWTQEIFDRLQLDKNIPIVTVVNDIPNKFENFSTVLMVPQSGGIYPVKFNKTVNHLSPSTGNMALGFACCCRPDQIYLFGLDFGYRDTFSTHAAESFAYKEKGSHKKALGSGHLPVEANFSGVSPVYSQAYFNSCRQMAVVALAAYAGGSEIYNCSDGAKIDGAAPLFSREIEPRSYDKSMDIELIHSAFSPLEKGVHWQPFPLSGQLQLDEYKKALLKVLKLKKFNWMSFSEKINSIDTLITARMPRKISRERDTRLKPYDLIINDLLVAWYKLLCFTNNEIEWQLVYDEGYKQLALLVDELTWPDGV